MTLITTSMGWVVTIQVAPTPPTNFAHDRPDDCHHDRESIIITLMMIDVSIMGWVVTIWVAPTPPTSTLDFAFCSPSSQDCHHNREIDCHCLDDDRCLNHDSIDHNIHGVDPIVDLSISWAVCFVHSLLEGEMPPVFD